MSLEKGQGMKTYRADTRVNGGRGSYKLSRIQEPRRLTSMGKDIKYAKRRYTTAYIIHSSSYIRGQKNIAYERQRQTCIPASFRKGPIMPGVIQIAWMV